MAVAVLSALASMSAEQYYRITEHLDASRTATPLLLEKPDGSLISRNRTGQPARVLTLLRIAEECPTLAGA